MPASTRASRRAPRARSSRSDDVCRGGGARRRRKLDVKAMHDRAFGGELFLFLAARADLVGRVIRPALAGGEIVIADRFGLSTIAYQVAGRGLPQADVEAALRVATGGLTPDLTLILDIPVT